MSPIPLESVEFATTQFAPLATPLFKSVSITACTFATIVPVVALHDAAAVFAPLIVSVIVPPVTVPPIVRV
jgi:hypothetical protein